MYYMRQPTSTLSAAVYTFTAGLVLPALIFLWVTGGLSLRSTPAAAPAPRVAAATSVPVATPLAEQLGSKWVSQSAPAAILVDGTARVTMKFQNIGAVPWVKGSPSEVRLGVVGEDPSFHAGGFAVDWPMPTRVAVQSERIVRPGGHATFVFEVKGATPGRLRIPVRPVVDGVSWLTAEGAYVEIVVGAISAPGPRPSPA